MVQRWGLACDATVTCITKGGMVSMLTGRSYGRAPHTRPLLRVSIFATCLRTGPGRRGRAFRHKSSSPASYPCKANACGGLRAFRCNPSRDPLTPKRLRSSMTKGHEGQRGALSLFGPVRSLSPLENEPLITRNLKADGGFDTSYVKPLPVAADRANG